MHRTKDALKLLSQLLSRVIGPRQRHLFFGLARLYAKHGLNKDALVIKVCLESFPPQVVEAFAGVPCLLPYATSDCVVFPADFAHSDAALTAGAKLPSLCNQPPDRRTWELLKSMAECTPVAVEQQLQKYIEEAGPGHFTRASHH